VLSSDANELKLRLEPPGSLNLAGWCIRGNRRLNCGSVSENSSSLVLAVLIPLDVAHDSGNDLARLYRFDLARDSEIIGIHIAAATRGQPIAAQIPGELSFDQCAVAKRPQNVNRVTHRLTI